MTDEMIVALAKKGGVVQINFNCGFLQERRPTGGTRHGNRCAPRSPMWWSISITR